MAYIFAGFRGALPAAKLDAQWVVGAPVPEKSGRALSTCCVPTGLRAVLRCVAGRFTVRFTRFDTARGLEGARQAGAPRVEGLRRLSGDAGQEPRFLNRVGDR